MVSFRSFRAVSVVSFRSFRFVVSGFSTCYDDALYQLEYKYFDFGRLSCQNSLSILFSQ